MSELSEKFNLLEKRRTNLLQKIEALPEEVKYIHPKTGKWSIVQILEHLRVAEKQTLKAIKNSLETRTEFKDTTFQSDLNLFIAKLRFASRIPMKAPAYVSKIAEKPDIEYILKDWQDVRFAYKNITETITAEMEKKIIFKHPIVGLMNIHHVLEFFLAHFKVHERRILNITRAHLRTF